MQVLVHMRTLKPPEPPVNGTKVVIWSLITILCLCVTSVHAAAVAEGLRVEHRESNWPIGTTAVLIVMLFYTWWLQMQHRRRMEQANGELKPYYCVILAENSPCRTRSGRSSARRAACASP